MRSTGWEVKTHATETLLRLLQVDYDPIPGVKVFLACRACSAINVKMGDVVAAVLLYEMTSHRLK